MLERVSRRRRRVEPGSEAERLLAENAELRVLVGDLRAENEHLRATIGTLQQWIEALTSKLAINSRNSSKPPSTDGPATPPRRRKKGSRKLGGQPGHEGTTRAMVPVEQVNEVVDCLPTCCEACRALLLGEDPAP